MRITITVKNLDRVTRKLNDLNRIDYLRPVVSEGARILSNELKRYPPKPPQSTYRRTNILKHGWNTKVSGGPGGWLGVVGNRVNYAPFVQDTARQARVHQGRWQTVQSVARDKAADVTRFCVQAIRRWLAKG